MKQTLLVADGHRMVAEGVGAVLSDMGYHVDLAFDGQAVLDRIRNHRYQLAIVDAQLPEVDGLTVLRMARADDIMTKFLMVSSERSHSAARLSLLHGAHGFVTRDASVKEMRIAIRRIQAGSTYISFKPTTEQRPCIAEQLTARQMEIVARLATGRRAKQVARDLNVSVRTVESHKFAAMQACGISSFLELTTILHRAGLLRVTA